MRWPVTDMQADLYCGRHWIRFSHLRFKVTMMSNTKINTSWNQEPGVMKQNCSCGSESQFYFGTHVFFPSPLFCDFFFFTTLGLKIFIPRRGWIQKSIFFLSQSRFFFKWTIALDSHWGFSPARADMKEDTHFEECESYRRRNRRES